MRLLPLFAAAALATTLCAQEKPTATAAAPTDADAQMLRRIYDAALVDSPAYENLRELTARFPGRLAGTPAYHGAEQWGEEVLKKIGCDRTELQQTMVPHWERGAAESVRLVRANANPPRSPPSRSAAPCPRPPAASPRRSSNSARSTNSRPPT